MITGYPNQTNSIRVREPSGVKAGSQLTQERARELVLALPEVKQFLAKNNNAVLADMDSHVNSEGTLFFDFWAYWDMGAHASTHERYFVNSTTGNIYKLDAVSGTYLKYVNGGITYSLDIRYFLGEESGKECRKLDWAARWYESRFGTPKAKGQ